MATAKERLLELVQQQPEDATYDEIMRELAFERMVERGLEDVAAGKTIPHEEVGRRIREWGK